MTLHLYTTEEKLREIERLLEDGRRVGDRNEVLRAIAADLRGRLSGAPSVALRELERRLIATKRPVFGGGRQQGKTSALIGVAEELSGRWPVVKQALERFGAAVEQGD